MDGLDERCRGGYICTVTRRSLFRLAAIKLLLVVVLTQAGLALLHTHQGMPDRHPVALQADEDANASCPVCTLDAVMDAEPSAIVSTSDAFSTPSCASFVSCAVLLPYAGHLKGRAPPVC